MPTRVAIVSDVHADARALADALARIDEMGADLVLCAGDVVDYGVDPEGVLRQLRERAIPTIRGNHDRWAVGPSSAERAERALSPEALAFLRGLPAKWDAELEGVRVAMRHGTPTSDMRGVWPIRTDGAALAGMLDAAAADVLIVGHTHLPLALEVGDRVVVNPGSLLREPKPQLARKRLLFDPLLRTFVAGGGRGGGTFGVLDLPSRRFRVLRAADGKEIRAIHVRLG